MTKSSTVTHTIGTLQGKYNFSAMVMIIQIRAGVSIFHFKWEMLVSCLQCITTPQELR